MSRLKLVFLRKCVPLLSAGKKDIGKDYTDLRSMAKGQGRLFSSRDAVWAKEADGRRGQLSHTIFILVLLCFSFSFFLSFFEMESLSVTQAGCSGSYL